MIENRTSNRILALVAIAATVLVMLFSTVFISEHVSHHCDDEAHCPICLVLEQCESNIKSIGAGLIVAAVVYVIAFAMKDIAGFIQSQPVQASLVSQKVRIDS
ncbi:MAG: hypothetical protein IIU31_00600 [Pseudobutyrivibrio sp.]|nr:hypothetical protein [Pseudobutyrivibrio sp.]